jgi:hypothetical protein
MEYTHKNNYRLMILDTLSFQTPEKIRTLVEQLIQTRSDLEEKFNFWKGPLCYQEIGQGPQSAVKHLEKFSDLFQALEDLVNVLPGYIQELLKGVQLDAVWGGNGNFDPIRNPLVDRQVELNNLRNANAPFLDQLKALADFAETLSLAIDFIWSLSLPETDKKGLQSYENQWAIIAQGIPNTLKNHPAFIWCQRRLEEIRRTRNLVTALLTRIQQIYYFDRDFGMQKIKNLLNEESRTKDEGLVEFLNFHRGQQEASWMDWGKYKYDQLVDTDPFNKTGWKEKIHYGDLKGDITVKKYLTTEIRKIKDINTVEQNCHKKLINELSHDIWWPSHLTDLFEQVKYFHNLTLAVSNIGHDPDCLLAIERSILWSSTSKLNQPEEENEPLFHWLVTNIIELNKKRVERYPGSNFLSALRLADYEKALLFFRLWTGEVINLETAQNIPRKLDLVGDPFSKQVEATKKIIHVVNWADLFKEVYSREEQTGKFTLSPAGDNQLFLWCREFADCFWIPETKLDGEAVKYAIPDPTTDNFASRWRKELFNELDVYKNAVLAKVKLAEIILEVVAKKRKEWLETYPEVQRLAEDWLTAVVEQPSWKKWFSRSKPKSNWSNLQLKICKCCSIAPDFDEFKKIFSIDCKDFNPNQEFNCQRSKGLIQWPLKNQEK